MQRNRITADLTNRNYVPHLHKKLVKTYPELTQTMVAKILDTYFSLAQDDLSRGNSTELGAGLGELIVTKKKKSVFLNEEGNVVNDMPVDMAETYKLWRENPSLKGKRFVRYMNDHSDGYQYRLVFRSAKGKWKNRTVYKFQFSNTLKKKLSENIINGQTEAFVDEN